MRIILLTSWFLEYTIELANALARRGDKITLILPKGHVEKLLSGSFDVLLDHTVKVKFLNYGIGRNMKNALRTVFATHTLLRYINAIRPDVIHLQESGNITIYSALPFLNSYPIVSTIHEPNPARLFGRLGFFFLRKIPQMVVVHYSDKIIVHGGYLKELAVSNFNIDKEDVYIIPHGDFSIFKLWDREGGIEEEANSILFFGKIHERKGLKYLIKAEPIISRAISELKIIIAGSGDYFQECKKIMINKERFECHNRFIPNEAVPELFQRASVVVLPYIDASQSGVIPIAYAFKKPVVVTDVGSIPEVVDDGVTGFIVPSRDEKALAGAIIKLLKDEKLRKKMGEDAYKKMKEELSWDKIAEKTIEVYKEVIANEK